MKQFNFINWYEFLDRVSDIVNYFYMISSEFVKLEKGRFAIYKIKPLKEIQCKKIDNKIIMKTRDGVDVLENINIEQEAYYVLDLYTLQPLQKLFNSQEDALLYIYEFTTEGGVL